MVLFHQTAKKQGDTNMSCTDDTDEGPAPVGIALSGGGTRAAMMGVGAIRRLYELGILRRATTISSVSGGSIVNAVLAIHWVELMETEGVDLELFDRLIAGPVREICQTMGHKMNPVRMVKRVRRKIKRELGFTPTHLGLHLAKYMPAMDVKLSDLPKPNFSLHGGVPRFVFCGADLSTGKPFYFSQDIVGHGLSKNMKVKSRSGAYPILSEELTHAIPLTQAVGASSAVPIVFEPLQLTVEVNNEDYTIGIVDGAVYDNLGLEPLIGEDNAVMLEGCEKRHKVIFVNDAGAPWFLPLDKFSGKHMVRRVTRALTIALSRGHDERVRFLDLMYKRHLLYGACWRLGDLERLFDKFTEEELAAMKDLCFPSKQVFDPLLITRIIEFRTDLNELKPAEIRVLENAGYSLAAFKFHQYVCPLLRDRDLVDTSYFTAAFKFPLDNDRVDDNREVQLLTDELKNSYSLIKSNIKPKHFLRRKRSAFECQFQMSQSTRTLHSDNNDEANLQNFSEASNYIEEGEESGESGESGEEGEEQEESEYESGNDENENEDGNGHENHGAGGEYGNRNHHYSHDPNHPLYKIEPSKRLYEAQPSSGLLQSTMPSN